jgi:LacI family transcriptional regulator
MNKPSHRATLENIAKHAGVSVASVSRVLNNKMPMSDHLRAQVLEAAESLGYEPKHHDLHITTNKKASNIGVIALLITETVNPYFHEIVQGAQDEAERANLFSVVVNSTPNEEHENIMLQTLSALPLCGVILCAGQLASDSLLDYYERSGIPLVVINRRVARTNVPCIVIDYENALLRVTQHLLSLGHTRIAYLAGPTMVETSQLRRRGIELALSSQGLNLRPEFCPASLPNVTGGFQAMSNILQIAEAERPTAVIAYNDLIAIGALNAVRATGLRVPEDISVIGFDDIPMAPYTNPPLTTVAIPKYQIGKLAVQTLCQGHAEQTGSGGYTQIEGSLIVRDSTSAAVGTTAGAKYLDK